MSKHVPCQPGEKDSGANSVHVETEVEENSYMHIIQTEFV